jgi:hypothetical protein
MYVFCRLIGGAPTFNTLAQEELTLLGKQSRCYRRAVHAHRALLQPQRVGFTRESV